MLEPVNVMAVLERVTRRLAISQNDFIDFFNETAEELENAYGGSYVLLPEAVFGKSITAIDDECEIDARYEWAIVYNVLYLASKDESYLSEYQAKAQAAYLDRWRAENQHRRIKGDVRR